MRSVHDPVTFGGVLTSISQLAIRFGINRQTLMDRWRKLGYPDEIQESMLEQPLVGGAGKIPITLDGVPVSMPELTKVATVTAATLYRRIKIFGPDLKSGDIHGREETRGGVITVKRKEVERIKINVPEYDPEDRSPGWCERKYEFLRNAGSR